MEQLRNDHQRDLEELKDELTERREGAAKLDQAQELVAKYRDPLLRSAFDLQSRMYNVLRTGGFRGGRDPEYFRLNTLFVIAEFLGWLEIIRRDMQFLDLGGTTATKELAVKLSDIQDLLASTTHWSDDYYIYRGQQRAIGELMISRLDSPTILSPNHECMGYASFVAKQEDPDFTRWFNRLGEAIQALPGQRPARLVALQNAIIDLIDFLDPEKERFVGGRSRLDMSE